jgi:hypothetical protein
MNTIHVTSFVPFKTDNISSINGELNLNTNIAIKGEIRIVNSSGDNEFKIDNAGFVRAREVKVDFDLIPDYVFKQDYKLMSLNELENYIKDKKHLPNIKGENEFDKSEGMSLGEMNMKLLEKVEELTLYIIAQNKRIEALEKQSKK